MTNSSDVAVVALGANLPSAFGGPRKTLEHALSRLDGGRWRVKRRSRWWRTPAYPPGSGPDFINGVALLETVASPAETLAQLHEVEAELGRERRARWAPRTVDLDLLAMGATVLPDLKTAHAWLSMSDAAASTATPDTLVLPHPRLQERAFVLAPMVDVAPEWRHPVLDQTARQLLEALPPSALEGVAPIDEE